MWFEYQEYIIVRERDSEKTINERKIAKEKMERAKDRVIRDCKETERATLMQTHNFDISNYSHLNKHNVANSNLQNYDRLFKN